MIIIRKNILLLFFFAISTSCVPEAGGNKKLKKVKDEKSVTDNNKKTFNNDGSNTIIINKREQSETAATNNNTNSAKSFFIPELNSNSKPSTLRTRPAIAEQKNGFPVDGSSSILTNNFYTQGITLAPRRSPVINPTPVIDTNPIINLPNVINTAVTETVEEVASDNEVKTQAASMSNCSANTTYNNITYSGSTKLNLFTTDTNQSLKPIVLQVHGGGWANGDKDLIENKYASDLSKRGFSVINIDYRKGVSNPYPAALLDINCALKWVARNAKICKFDLDKVYIGGGSAGAHLTTLYSLNRNAYKDQSCSHQYEAPNIRKVFALSLPSYLDAGDGGSSSKKWVNDFLGTTSRAVGSPLSYTRNKYDTSYFLIHGRDDKLTRPSSQVFPFLKEMASAGQKITYKFIENVGHDVELKTSAGRKRRSDDLVSFFNTPNNNVRFIEPIPKRILISQFYDNIKDDVFVTSNQANEESFQLVGQIFVYDERYMYPANSRLIYNCNVRSVDKMVSTVAIG